MVILQNSIFTVLRIIGFNMNFVPGQGFLLMNLAGCILRWMTDGLGCAGFHGLICHE